MDISAVVSVIAAAISAGSLAVAFAARRDSKRSAGIAERQDARSAKLEHESDGPQFTLVKTTQRDVSVARFVFQTSGGPGRMALHIRTEPTPEPIHLLFEHGV